MAGQRYSKSRGVGNNPMGWLFCAPCSWPIFGIPFYFILAALFFSCNCSCGCGCAAYWAKLVKPCFYFTNCAFFIYLSIAIAYYKLARAIDYLWCNCNFTCFDKWLYFGFMFLNFAWFVTICYCHSLEAAVYIALLSWIMSLILMLKVFEVSYCHGISFLGYQLFATYVVVLTSALFVLN